MGGGLGISVLVSWGLIGGLGREWECEVVI